MGCGTRSETAHARLLISCRIDVVVLNGLEATTEDTSVQQSRLGSSTPRGTDGILGENFRQGIG